MIFKYTSRLIKSTFNRFIAILAIVFIGVSFMMGLRSNYNIMKNSVEKYTDEHNLYDIQIYSNYGFDDSDARAIRKLDYVENVFASKTRDVYSKDKNNNIFVTRVMELNSGLNTIELIEGRMPLKDNECLVVSGYSKGEFEINDSLKLYLEDSEIKDIVKNDKYTIVGRARAIENFSKTYSTSSLDNKDLNIVIYVPNNNFVSEYYSIIYIGLTGAKELYSFSNEYEKFVDEKAESLEEFSVNQSQALRNKIIDESRQELDDAKKELEDKKQEYEKEFEKARKKLASGKKELDEAKKKIEDGERQIPESEKLLKDGQAQINAGYEELKANEQKLNDGIAQIENYGMSMDQLESSVTSIFNSYTCIKNSRDNNRNELNELKVKKDECDNIIASSRFHNSVEVGVALRLVDKDRFPETYAKLEAEYNAFLFNESYQTRVNAIKAKIVIDDGLILAEDSAMKAIISMGVEEGYNYIIGSINEIKNGKVLIAQGYEKLAESEKQIKQGYIELEKGKQDLINGKAEYEKGIIEYKKGLKEYNEGLDEYNKQIQDAQDKIEDGEDELKNLEKVEWTILNRYDTNYSFYMYKNTCEQMKSIGTIIPILFFVVAALVCSTTMTRLIDEQRTQIGIYCALGFRKREILNIYLLYVIIASFAASLVAVFAGVLIFPAIIYNTWRLMYDLPNIIISLPIDNLIICVLCFTLLMMFVTFVVVNKTLSECSAQLLRPKPLKNTKQILLEKWKWLWSKLPFTSKVTARNLFRYKGRFIMTIVGVAGCTSLLLMGWGIKDSISSMVNLQYSEIDIYNYYVDLKNDRHIGDIMSELRKDKNNEVIVPMESYQTVVTRDDKDATITTMVFDKSKQTSIVNLVDYNTKKEQLISDDGVLITNKFASNENIHVGDVIEIESKEGIKGKVKVEGIVNNYIFHNLFMSETLYKKLFNEEIEYSSIAVVNRNDPTQLLSVADKFNDINTVNDLNGAGQRFMDMVDALNLIIMVIILVAGALAFVVLINLTNVNISERIREIATLKVLGFREKEVNSYIFKEVALMSVVGAIIGLPLGVIEERYILTVIDMEMVAFPHIIHPISYLYAFGLTIIFTIIVLILTRKTLKNVEMVESLKSVE